MKNGNLKAIIAVMTEEQIKQKLLDLHGEIDIKKSELTDAQIATLVRSDTLICRNPKCIQPKSHQPTVLLKMTVPEFWVALTKGEQEIEISPREIYIECIRCQSDTHVIFKMGQKSDY